jgi:signal transduction histidine kinase
VEAIEADEPFAAQATWARKSLLGAPGEKGAECAAQRLRGYAERLVQLGRAHALRLNLRRADAALSALLLGFDELQNAAPLMDKAARLGPSGQRRLLRALRRAARLLNVEGYEAVRALLDRLRVLNVDRALVQAVFDRTRGEPGLQGVAVAPLALDAEEGSLPVVIAAPRHAFDDILTNLLRNALQSSQRHCPAGDQAAPLRVGLSVRREEDLVTGLVRVVFAVQDASPQPLTPEMLRGRYIEAGLGLTADLVSRYEGTLDVRAEPAPWTKAVVVKLPAPDPEDENEPFTL